MVSYFYFLYKYLHHILCFVAKTVYVFLFLLYFALHITANDIQKSDVFSYTNSQFLENFTSLNENFQKL